MPAHGTSNMLSSGNAISKTSDWTRRKFLFVLPSTSTDRFVAPSTNTALIARNSLTPRGGADGWPHTPGVLMLTEFMTGKKVSLPSGTAHVRAAEPPENVPARNHSEPCCPTMQLPPVVSSSGLTGVGIERAHCCHSALNCLKFPPAGSGCG